MNNILSWIFFGEMVVKLIGLGIKSYASDSFNLFDCAVVVISLVENIIDWLGISFSGGGAISALRAIRLSESSSSQGLGLPSESCSRRS
jgi:hypothetical protein